MNDDNPMQLEPKEYAVFRLDGDGELRSATAGSELTITRTLSAARQRATAAARNNLSNRYVVAHVIELYQAKPIEVEVKRF